MTQRNTATAVILALFVVVALVETAECPPSRRENAAWEAVASEQHAAALARHADLFEYALQSRITANGGFALVGLVAALGAAVVF
jgi:hypothetical protein